MSTSRGISSSQEMPAAQAAQDRRWLDLAARLALRGHGGAEPNPLVGCALVDGAGVLVGWGFHHRCGGPHAEAAALARAGSRANGATAYVSLEPCAHHGRTHPCAQALVNAGISRVVYAVSDGHRLAAGGAAVLRAAGVSVQRIDHKGCVRVSDPFVTRMTAQRPWIVAKWAQTIDGRTATRAGDSRWISGEVSRAMVHRERARVDAVMVGIGTLLADDAHLLPRANHAGVARRIPLRVIVDPRLATPTDARVIQTSGEGAVMILALPTAIERLHTDRRKAFTAAGITLEPLHDPAASDAHRSFRGLPTGALRAAMGMLFARGVSTVLVEGGAGLLGALFHEDLIDDAWCFTAPLVIADGSGSPVATGPGCGLMIDAHKFELLDSRRRGQDSMTLWRRIR
ncbi:MAG: bifunctional diaminohydroxyphosphoribosylaminopyrimidine deaminase/5-amino-6-(5-phosphoribosylamino)uracil reductase RibD [Phycisphaerales bacterium]|nr:bifunctional diaminohydroxyphosphoribosylaminopyrimidine deaminase/5-amino-6-(5-phosphoribosylamino)uracil reductase RibD [Phycisphaerales bacterium]